MPVRHILTSAVLLTGFAVFGAAVVAGIAAGTSGRIAANEEAALRARLHEVLPAALHDNDLLADTVTLDAPELDARGPTVAHIARKDGRPVAAVFRVVTRDGYSGAIRMLVGIEADGRLTGVRITAHRETPGLGDDIEAERSDWIERFRERSLESPPRHLWGVRRDGGAFDQFTGATVTPRAVVGAVKRALLYFERHHDRLFSEEDEDVRHGGEREDSDDD